MSRHSDVKNWIRKTFESNYEQLRAESGHSLSPDVRDAALQEVLLYWERLHELAKKITETEVRLNLPNQRTRTGRKFGIDGVVDIVREHDRTTMYDIKTHDPEFIEANLEFYQQQLNVYAHIWQKIREQQLDETAVISTHVPNKVREKLDCDDPTKRAAALEAWNPVIPIPFDSSTVDGTIEDFGVVVDAIECGEFSPPSTSKLKQREYGRKTFGTRVCGNCDVRFSCSSYREYVKQQATNGRQRSMGFYEIFFDDQEREAWRESALGGAVEGE